MKPSKILYVIGTLDIGGTERQLVEMISRLNKDEFLPVVCCLSEGGPLEDRLRAAGIKVEVVGFRGFLRYRGADFVRKLPRIFGELRHFVSFIKSERPAIVHGLLYWAYVLGGLGARLSSVPVIVASRRGLAIFKTGRPHYRVLEWMANRFTRLIIANSEAVKQDTMLHEGIQEGRITVVHNGLDLVAFDALAAAGGDDGTGVDGQGPTVAVLANLIHYKGHEYFLRAWQEVAPRYPRATALLIGDGPLRPKLERTVSRNGMGGSVRFLGTREDVPALLRRATVVVHPSLEEGFSNAVLEGMAAGRPVVAAAVGGNAEAVIDGETGYLVPPRDSEALVAAMIRLFDDPVEAERMGEAGRRRVGESFTIEAMVEQYEAIYREMLRRHARPPEPSS